MENNLPSPPATHAQWGFFSGARAALAFLTRIPCGRQPIREAALYWASAWFPAVGYFLGFLACLVWVGLQGAGFLVASVAAVAALALVTGGFHEDGLADTADALGGAFEREKLFVILKDSRIGSFGATALILVLLLRVAALAKVGPLAVGGLLLGQTLSRTTPVWLMAALPYVTPSGTARSSNVASNVVGGHLAHALIASAFAACAACLLVVSGFLPVRPVVLSVAVSAVVAVVCGWRFHVRAGGLTGDFLGATQQVTDAATLVVLAASL